MDMSKILVVVKFGGALIFFFFLLWDFDFLGVWEFLGHVILVMGFFFFFFFFVLREIFDHVVLVMENFLDMWS